MPASGIYGSFIFNSYVRFAPVPKVALADTFTVKAQTRFSTGTPTIRILGGDRALIAESPPLKPSVAGSLQTFTFTFNRAGWPFGNLMQSFSASDFPWVFINAPAKGQPLTGKQWIMVQAYNLHGEFMRGARGWEGVYIDPAVEFPRGSVIKAHAAKHCDGVHYPLAKWWTEPLTSTGGQQEHREIQIIDDGACKPGEGHYAVAPIEPYTQNGNFEYDVMGQCRDGYMGVGRVGSAWNGYVQRGGEQSGAGVFTCGSPRIARVNLDGYVETLFGMRLKDPSRPAPYHYKPYRKEWAQGAYEQVGVIVDGDNFLINPWQAQQHPEDPNTIVVNDADQHRYVIYDVRLKKGKTLAGSLKREAGYRDGKGTEARFNAPRGGVFRKNRAGKWVYVGADDHNSALRSIDPETGETGTYWKCPGYFDPDGTPHDNMNDLALRLSSLAYVVGGRTIPAWGLNGRTWWYDGEAKRIRPFEEAPQGGTWKDLNTDPDWLISRIRPYMRSGSLAAAVGMHPQALFLMPDNDIGMPQHHPHMVARVHLVEREDGSIDQDASWLRHLCEMPLLLQAGKLEKGWISASGDPDGACGEPGDFAVGYFPMGSNLRYRADGVKRGTYVDLGASMRWLGSYPGPSANSAHTGYPHAVAFGWDGSLWWVPTAGEGAMRMTLQDGSEPKLDAAKFKRGMQLIDQSYAEDAPQATFRRGYLHSRLGEPDVRHFHGRPAEFRAFIRTWVQSRYWTDEDVEAVAYTYEWANANMVELLAERPTNLHATSTPPTRDPTTPIDDVGTPIPGTHEDDDATSGGPVTDPATPPTGGPSTEPNEPPITEPPTTEPPTEPPPPPPPPTADELRAQLVTLRTQLLAGQDRLAQLDAAIAADQASADAASRAIATAQSAIDADQAIIAAAAARMATNTAALAQAQATLDAANAAVTGDQTIRDQLRGSLATTTTAITQTQAALDVLEPPVVEPPVVVVDPPTPPPPPPPPPPPVVTAQGAFLIELGAAESLFEKGPDVPLWEASITKLWSLLLMARTAKMDDVVSVNDRATHNSGSLAGLVNGEVLTLYDAMMGMELPSGNDAALAAAEAVGFKYFKAATAQYGIKQFVARLNTFAPEIGCTKTRFYDPHGNNGMHDVHYTTPRDVCRVLALCLADPIVAEMMATKSYTCTTNLMTHPTWYNANPAIWNYPGTIGGKPGGTQKGGRHLTVAAKRGGVTLLACALVCATTDPFIDVAAMLDYGFAVRGVKS